MSIDAKGLLQSRTFWVNVIQTILWAAGVVPPQYGVPIALASNFALRLVTESPISGLWK